MSNETLESYLQAYLNSQPDGTVTLAWQGGEPTLRGLEFFQRAADLAEQLRRPGQRVEHTIQTNGTLLNDQWCQFLAEQHFLVGLSIDGPSWLHDTYRINKASHGSHAWAIRGWRLLQRHGVEANILCTVNAANASYPLEVYRYFRDELEARFLQFIPVVERVEKTDLAAAEAGWVRLDGSRILYSQHGNIVTSRSVDPNQWGEFLCTIFDEWITHDVGKIFVQHFEVTLSALFSRYPLCVHAPECGQALAIEHNGDVYSCDHYVEPDYLLGNIAERSFASMLASPFQRDFGHAKLTELPAQCRHCPVRWACNGGCPKDRFDTALDGERNLNHLCTGYYRFFTHIAPTMQVMSQLLLTGRPASDIMTRRPGQG